MKRREFLRSTVRASSLVASTAALSSCATFDRLFSLEKENLEDEVLIIGAGASGLMAGYELKKKKIPFRIFEASDRVGGRIYSITTDAESQNNIELGAETFEERHQIIFDLARELNLEFQDVEAHPKLDSLLLFTQNKWWSSKDIQLKFNNMTTRVFKLRLKLLSHLGFKNRNDFMESVAAQGFDQVNVTDLLKRYNLNIDPFWKSYIETQCLKQLGGSLSEVSGLSWLLQGEKEDRAHQQYRISGGFQQLTYNMFERLSGVIPDYRLRFQSPLIEIQKTSSGFKLYFQTPSGVQIYKSKYVIFALPFSQLSKIRKLTSLGIDEKKSRAILALRSAKNIKHSLLFKDAFWKNKSDLISANQGRWIGGSYLQSTWDSSLQKSGSKRKNIISLMQYQELAGSKKSTAENLDLAIKELVQMYPKVQSFIAEESYSMNWSQKKFIEGDQVVYQPGQASQFNQTIWSADFSGSLQWAGEYTQITDSGTVAGALSSGQRAAEAISQIYRLTGI